MPPKRERGPEVVGGQPKDMAVVPRIGDDQKHAIDASVAALKGELPLEGLNVVDPRLRLDG